MLGPAAVIDVDGADEATVVIDDDETGTIAADEDVGARAITADVEKTCEQLESRKRL